MKFPRASKQVTYNKWRIGAFALVHALILFHLFLWYKKDWKIFGSIGMEELFRSFLQKGIANTGALFFLVLCIFAWLWGRAFCGWACHIGLLYDVLDPLYNRFLPKHATVLRLGPWMASLILVYFFIWPALFTRVQGQGNAVWTVNLAQTEPWAILPGWGMAAVILGWILVILPIFLGKRAFCKTLCPWGASFGFFNMISRLKIRKVSSCSLCGKCSHVCPMDIDVSHVINTEGHVSSVKCTACLYCVDVCSDRTLQFTFKHKAVPVIESHASRCGVSLTPSKTFLTLPMEFLFWTLTFLTGKVYSEIYGIGHFLAFSIGLTAAQISLFWGMFIYKEKVIRGLVPILFLVLLWGVIAKDGVAHYTYIKGLKSFSVMQWTQSQEQLELSDTLFWYAPTELYLKLYIIYKTTGQKTKQVNIKTRYDARRESRKN